ncbi:IPTL-CTERM sorting domain-containing protein [Brevundimonas sp.]|uniref:IPTL-CTERM sorting domain-containing protein n=1 Tax=Brevundimonas sp. TaxID=1871086 RepID=UPI003D0D8F61
MGALTRRQKRAAALGAAVWVMVMPAGPALTQSICGGTSQTFSPSASAGSRTDGTQPFHWTAPAGVTSVVVRARGAEGGASTLSAGGRGAEILATYPVTPGERLCIVVGVAGQETFDFSGGGGGASFVFSSGALPCLLSNASVANLRVAAAGGGGAYYFNGGLPGRAAGVGIGAAGAVSGSGAAGGGTDGRGGGSDGSMGGGGGGLLTDGGMSFYGYPGQALIHGGGGGGPNIGSTGDGGFGGGGFGGGGGGYNGGAGAGGGSSTWPGGGGGSFSSVVPTSAQDGQQAGNGEVSLCFSAAPAPVPTLSEWAMIGLMGLLAMFGLVLMDRRRRFPA